MLFVEAYDQLWMQQKSVGLQTAVQIYQNNGQPAGSGPGPISGIGTSVNTSLGNQTFYPSAAGVAAAGTTGTNTSDVANQFFLTPMYIGNIVKVTGLAFLVGGTQGSDNALVAIWDANGTLLATSALAGAAWGSTNTYQKVALTAAITIPGPAWYWTGVQGNGTTSKIQTVPHAFFNSNVLAGTFGTVGNITPPTTNNANTAPYMATY